MTVYIDVLFAVNMFINYFLLLITAGFAKTVCKRPRVLAASIVGGLYCVFAFTSSLSLLQSTFTKLLLTAVISLISFGFGAARRFVRCTVIFLAVGFFFGGLLYGIYFLIKPELMYINNSAVYFHISPILLILLSIVSYLAITLFTYLLKPQTLDSSANYTVHITYHMNTVSAQGFVDTGNMLSDVFTDTPVIVCSFDTVRPLFSEDEGRIFKNSDYMKNISSLPKKIRLVPVSTVGGSALLPSFKPDNLVLETNGKKYSIEKVLISVFNRGEYNSEHSVILNPELVISKNQGGVINVL